ncbi:MAG: hypothetical protein M1831_003457 [Alyxoria varia]|nr:MAG: hypothetical protein M1831_003457 [Alyxoria varia]
MTTALLIIDPQTFFTPMLKSAVPQILKLHSHFRSKHLPIFITQHGHPDSDFVPPITNQLVLKWGVGGSLHRGSREWEFVDAIRPLATAEENDNVMVIAKNTYDGFVGTELEDVLREKKVDRVVLCGVMTDCCVDTTARSAFNKGWRTVVAGDACGTDSREKQKRVLEQIDFAFGEVMDTEEVIRKVDR